MGGLVAMAFVAGSVLTGCATSRSVSPAELVPVKMPFQGERAAKKEVEDARKQIEAGDASAVIPLLLETINKYPNTKAATEGRYWLGRAYYEIGGYRDSMEMFSEYVKLAPEGTYSAECKEYLAKVGSEYGAKFPSPEELDKQISEMNKRVEAYPGDLDGRMKLADLLWLRGDYPKAGAVYKGLVSENPNYANDEKVAARVQFLPNGEYVLLTPAELQRREAEAKPLVVINTSNFQSGRDLFTRESNYYAVTGQVVNRGDSVLYGVQVIITLYGVGNTIYDTTTVSIGRMNPKEIRAFSVRFSNFENIENVNRYECVPTFER